MDERDAWITALADEAAQAAREAFTRCAASAITDAGKALEFMAPDDAVRGLAVATAMGGSLARGTCALLDGGNGYAAAALLRQMVEVEYLWWTFADDAEGAARWLHASRSQLANHFRPAQMRERSNGLFRSAEYQAHCNQGGHPSPAGHALVSTSPPFDVMRMMRVDLGQHLERGWGLLVTACAAVDRSGAVQRDTNAVEAARRDWHEHDPLAQRSALPD